MFNWSDVRLFITKCYQDYLNRNPDPAGMEFYLKSIFEKKIALEQLPDIFVKSPEYQQIQQKKRNVISIFLRKRSTRRTEKTVSWNLSLIL